MFWVLEVAARLETCVVVARVAAGERYLPTDADPLLLCNPDRCIWL